MADRTEPADISVDRDVVRRVGEDHRGSSFSHQLTEGRLVESAAAMQPVRTEQPGITRPGDRWSGGQRHAGIVGIGLGWDRCSLDQQIDLGHLEAGDLQVEIRGEVGEFAQLLAEQPVVPTGDFGQAIVGDHEGARLGVADVLQADRRDLGATELPAGEQSSVAGDDLVIGVDKDRHVEPEAPDTLGDLPDLFGRVPPWVARIGFELVDPAVNDFDRAIDARLFLASPSQFSLLPSAFIVAQHQR